MATKLKPVSTIIMDFGLEDKGEGHKFFADTCMKHMDKYVPKDNGPLRETAYRDSDCNIVYEQEYARYQYYGMREDGSHKVSNYTTPGTGPYWDKQMLNAESGDIVEEMTNYIKKRGNK